MVTLTSIIKYLANLSSFGPKQLNKPKKRKKIREEKNQIKIL